MNHTELCARRWQMQVNFVTVDFWSVGDLMEVVEHQNTELQKSPPYWQDASSTGMRFADNYDYQHSSFRS